MSQKNKFPIFIEYGHSLHKITSNTTYVTVEDDEYLTGVYIKKRERDNVKAMLANGIEITEETFNEMLLIVLTYLHQLTKKDSTPVKEYHIDDLKNVI